MTDTAQYRTEQARRSRLGLKPITHGYHERAAKRERLAATLFWVIAVASAAWIVGVIHG